MEPIEEVLKQIDHTIQWLEKRVENGDDFSDYTAKEELERIINLRDGLLYFKQEY
jgi:hypothetical protein